MKKIFLVPACLLFLGMAVNAQSKKKQAPPPPKPPVAEVAKFTPPTIVKDERVPPAAPKPPKSAKAPKAPKVEVSKFTPPKIVKDEDKKAAPSATKE